MNFGIYQARTVIHMEILTLIKFAAIYRKSKAVVTFLKSFQLNINYAKNNYVNTNEIKKSS